MKSAFYEHQHRSQGDKMNGKGHDQDGDGHAEAVHGHNTSSIYATSYKQDIITRHITLNSDSSMKAVADNQISAAVPV
jgi:hypothetical protein